MFATWCRSHATTNAVIVDVNQDHDQTQCLSASPFPGDIAGSFVIWHTPRLLCSLRPTYLG